MSEAGLRRTVATNGWTRCGLPGLEEVPKQMKPSSLCSNVNSEM